MGFNIYFVNTFPTEGSLEELYQLFTNLGWNVENFRIVFGKVADFLGLKEDCVVISSDFEEVSLFFNEGFVNVYLPISTKNWKEVEELLKKRVKVFKTYLKPSEEIEIPKGVRYLRNEKELSLVEPDEKLTGELNLDFYTQNGEPLELVVGKLLREKKLTVSTAESCTGGLLAATLVNVSGSSEYFKGSIVAYSNEIKEKVLGVQKETLEKFGAVSEETAKEMALGVKRLLNTDIGLSTTGIAGPTGGTPQKPVGLTYMAVAFGDQVKVFKEVFPYDRNQNRISAVHYLLFELYKLLKGLSK